MAGSRRKRPVEPFEAIEPPGNAPLVLGVLAVTALVEALGVLSGSEVWLLGLLVFLPGTASALCTVRQTAFVATWTTLVVTTTAVVRNADADRWLDRLLLVLLTLALGVASVYACHRRIRREHEMVRLRSTAAAMQRHILHPLPCSPTTCWSTASTNLSRRTGSSAATSMTSWPRPGGPGC